VSGAASAVVTADASGAYSFSGITDGSYTVTAAKSGFTFTPASRAVTVAGSSVTAADFSGGVDLLESDTAAALTEFALMWSDLMELRIVPVMASPRSQ